MKTQSNRIFIILAALMFLLGACQSSTPVAPGAATSEPIATATKVMPTATPTPIDPQALLQTAVDRFVEASSIQMNSHEVISYQGMAADGSVNAVYGEFNALYDILRDPEMKVHVQSQFRYGPDAAFTGEEYYLYEQGDSAYRLTLNDDEMPFIEEIGGQSVDSLLGDVYQTVLQYGKQAQFISQGDGEVVYVLDHPAWYTLQGAVGFADLGLLAMQPDGAELVKDYVEQAYPDVQTVRFILHVSIANQVITKVEMDNRDFMLSFWNAYNQALVDQGADPEQLTRYEIQPEHGSEFLFSSYGQVSDFDIPD
jgi:hypothetical protein